MSTIVSASVTFGLVSVPVNVTSVASPAADLSFKTLHVKCGTPIKLKKVCPVCPEDEQGDLSLCKGYEVAKKSFVMLDDDELALYASAKSSEIKLTKFVKRDQLNPLLVAKTYYLAPNETLYSTYAILVDALETSDFFGIGKSTLWGKEYPVAIEANESILHLHLLHCAEDMVSTVPIQAQAAKFAVTEEERTLAQMIVGLLFDDLTEEDLKSGTRERTMAYIEAKANSQPLPDVPSVEPVVPTVDIIETLKSTIEELATA